MPFSFSSLLHFHFFHGLLHLNALTKHNPPLKIAFAQLTLSHSIANKVIEGSEFKNIDFRMLRSFRVLRPLKLVSRTPSKYLPLPACHFSLPKSNGGKEQLLSDPLCRILPLLSAAAAAELLTFVAFAGID